MSYYDWEHLTKPFSITPVVQDTVENTKPLSLQPVDYVKQNVVYVELPATVFSTYAAQPVPLVIAQFNFSLGGTLSLVNILDNAFDAANGAFTNCCLAIRWRVGTVVHRYLLAKTIPPSMFRWSIPYPSYTGQLFGGNFVIEVWSAGTGVASLNKNLFLNIGRIYNPVTYEDVGNILQPSVIVPLSDLTIPLSVYPSNVLIPAMTSNTTPSGIASGANWNMANDPGGTNAYITAHAYLVFDQSASTWLHKGPSADTQSYVIYHFSSPKVVTRLRIDFLLSVYDNVGTMTVKGSNDGITYYDIGNSPYPLQNHPSTPWSIDNTFINTTAYSYYKVATSINYFEYVRISEIQLYGYDSSILSTTDTYSSVGPWLTN